MTDAHVLRRYAHVIGGKVVNVTVWDGETPVSRPEAVLVIPLPFTIDEGGIIRYTAGIGWDYVDGEFVDNRPVEEAD